MKILWYRFIGKTLPPCVFGHHEGEHYGRCWACEREGRTCMPKYRPAWPKTVRQSLNYDGTIFSETP